LASGILHDHLNERSGQLIRLPVRSRFTRFQAYDEIPDAHRLPRFHAKIARQTIALVKNAQGCDPLGHRRISRLRLGHFLDPAVRLGRGSRVYRVRYWVGAVGGRRQVADHRGRNGNPDCRHHHADHGRPFHCASGVQAS
jgi:hypothetical protein